MKWRDIENETETEALSGTIPSYWRANDERGRIENKDDGWIDFSDKFDVWKKFKLKLMVNVSVKDIVSLSIKAIVSLLNNFQLKKFFNRKNVKHFPLNLFGKNLYVI